MEAQAPQVKLVLKALPVQQEALELQGLMEAQAPQVKLVLKALPVQQEALELQGLMEVAEHLEPLGHQEV
jgi:hypothetical protein